jgi:hypothetical protein
VLESRGRLHDRQHGRPSAKCDDRNSRQHCKKRQDTAEHEDRLPTERAYRGSADYAADRRAERKAAKHDGYEQRSHALRSIAVAQPRTVVL